MRSLRSKFVPNIWQIAFILLATTWLWAPLLNQHISSRTSLISQYEAPGQSYGWLFRLGDVLSAALLLVIPLTIWVRRKMNVSSWLLLIIAGGLLIDAIFPTSCRIVANNCQEYTSFNYFIHAIETVITALSIFGLAIYDYAVRKRLLSAAFVLFQILCGILFVTQLANNNRFNTASQFVYLTVLVLWLAWYVRETFWQSGKFESRLTTPPIKNFFAIWALLNGFLAILVSLAHIHLLGKIHGIYFAGDTAWLAQHGVLIGIIMIYLSRHLARGERRARQIFLIICGIEVFKYAVISQHPVLLALYTATFCCLFVSGNSFIRGPVGLTWEIRLKDAAFFISAILVALILAFSFLDLDESRAEITNRSLDHFVDYTVRSKVVARAHLKSALLAHTGSVFIVGSTIILLWILFRPQAISRRRLPDATVRDFLNRYSSSSEDYFKLWPTDKDYFQVDGTAGFLAYKVAGPIAFALADPVSAVSQRAKLCNAFVNFCRQKGMRVCFLPVSASSLKLYKAAGLNEMQIGSTAVVDIEKFLNDTSRDKWWRWKTNRAIKAGYVYRTSQPPHTAQLIGSLKNVSNSWLQYAGRKERGFALGYFDNRYLDECSLSYLADTSEKPVAFVNRLPLFDQARVTTIDLLRYKPEAKDAMPFLLMKLLEELKGSNSGYKYFDLGFVPFAGAKGPILSIAKVLSAGRFSARGLEQFKNKFDPQWQPVYLAYDGDMGDLALIAVNLERAMVLSE